MTDKTYSAKTFTCPTCGLSHRYFTDSDKACCNQICSDYGWREVYNNLNEDELEELKLLRIRYIGNKHHTMDAMVVNVLDSDTLVAICLEDLKLYVFPRRIWDLPPDTVNK